MVPGKHFRLHSLDYIWSVATGGGTEEGGGSIRFCLKMEDTSFQERFDVH